MILLDGTKTSQKILQNIKSELQTLQTRNKRAPRLDMVLVGDDRASKMYVNMKERVARKAGFEGVIHHLDEETTTEDVIEKIAELNRFNGVDGFMVQLPMPRNIDEDKVLDYINPEKDVDGLTAVNLGKLFQGSKDVFVSATPLGIKLLLDEYGIEYEGKRVLIIGRSKEVGLPMFGLLNNENSTVTIAHSRTKDLRSLALQADILVSSVGMPKFITADMVKQDAIVVDVGINKDSDSSILVGDVDFLNVAPKCSYITPVPGGVGPMTIAALMWNTLRAYKAKA